MRQDMLDGLVTFVIVAEEKSFSAAAVRLGVSPSAVSQSISKLEGRMRLALFNRTTRSVSLTEAGLRYLERVVPAVHDLTAAARNSASRSTGRPAAAHQRGARRLHDRASTDPARFPRCLSGNRARGCASRAR